MKYLKYFAGMFAIAGIAFTGGMNVDTQSNHGGLFGGSYTVKATFDDVGGLKSGDNVSIAGIPVGKVESVALKDGLAVVTLDIDNGVPVEKDAVASVRTEGVLGGKYVRITPGGSDTLLADGDVLRETESVIDVERLISMQLCGSL